MLEDRARLAAIIGDRSLALKHVQRARIVLYSADRLPCARGRLSRRASAAPQYGAGNVTMPRMAPTGCCARAAASLESCPYRPATVAKVLALICAEPPGETTHWTGRAMAKLIGACRCERSSAFGRRISLQPHRWRTFKRSKDPAFAEKLEDIVGLYMHPPAHAVGSCRRSTRKARFRHSTALSPACR